MFAQVSTDQVIQGFGLPAAVVIIALVGVVIFLYRSVQNLQSKYDAIQEQRIVDARETRDKIAEPLDKMASLSEKTYELLLTGSRRS